MNYTGEGVAPSGLSMHMGGQPAMSKPTTSTGRS